MLTLEKVALQFLRSIVRRVHFHIDKRWFLVVSFYLFWPFVFTVTNENDIPAFVRPHTNAFSNAFPKRGGFSPIYTENGPFIKSPFSSTDGVTELCHMTQDGENHVWNPCLGWVHGTGFQEPPQFFSQECSLPPHYTEIADTSSRRFTWTFGQEILNKETFVYLIWLKKSKI